MVIEKITNHIGHYERKHKELLEQQNVMIFLIKLKKINLAQKVIANFEIN